MNRYPFSYAFDVPSYADFVIEAETQEEAERLAQILLKQGELSALLDDKAIECVEGSDNARVFFHQDGREEGETLHEIAEEDGRKVSADFAAWQEIARNGVTEPEPPTREQRMEHALKMFAQGHADGDWNTMDLAAEIAHELGLGPKPQSEEE